MAVASLLSVSVCLADVEKRDQFERIFQLAGGPAELIVDNVFGSVTVAAAGGNAVRVIVRQHWKADTQDDLAQAERDVRLDIGQSGNTVRVYVDGPFRDRGGNRGGRMRYRPNYDFEVQVPRQTALNVKTVLGDVEVSGTAEKFQVASVNGGAEMTDVTGSGQVKTVNGPVRVRFSSNPGGAVAMSTVNGGITAEFLPGLSADVQASTVNGGVYTDFEATALSPLPATSELRANGKRVYRSNGSTRVRIGSGGSALEFKTVNGDIKIRQRGAQ
jgi:DUF4097 and DUF4098 domain-containing protein YvlB